MPNLDLHPGDLVLFIRHTLNTLTRPRDALGWLGNWGIALTQRLFSRSAQGDYDGLWEDVHAGVIVEHAGQLCLLESTADRVPHEHRNGVRLCNPYLRIARYEPGVVVLPLNEFYRARWDQSACDDWIAKHGEDRYRWGGLPFSLIASAFSWHWPGALFCSEAVMDLYQHVGIVPLTLPVQRGRRIVEGDLRPERYSPAELGMLPQLARRKMQVLP